MSTAFGPVPGLNSRDRFGDLDGEKPIAPAVDDAYRTKVEKATEKFEGFMIAQMLKQMRRSMREMASDDSPMKNRINEDMLDMADQKVADSLASQRAFGLADAMLRQLLPPVPTVPFVPPKT